LNAPVRAHAVRSAEAGSRRDEEEPNRSSSLSIGCERFDNRIRAWLEPGYDHGRFGAWMLDLPGCFVWRTDEQQTLDAVTEAVAEFNKWLWRLGELMAA
jgi:hypothetical protein